MSAWHLQQESEEQEKESVMIFDTHAHYDDEAFDEDREQLISGLPSRGIEAVVNIGASIRTTENTLELVRKYPHVYGTAGVHPNETGELTDQKIDWLREAAASPGIVAVGEIGLDYYWDEPDRETQKYWFVRQLDLAREVKLPVVIHSRDAAKDTLDIMKAQKSEEIGGGIHFFFYGGGLGREKLEMGFFLGGGGGLTF